MFFHKKIFGVSYDCLCNKFYASRRKIAADVAKEIDELSGRN